MTRHGAEHRDGPVSTGDAAALVVPLDGSGHRSDAVGGKAASLDALIRRRFAVPAAIAVTTAAYRRFIAESSELRQWLMALQRTALPTPAHADRVRAETDERFLAAPLPPGLQALLASHLFLIAPDGELVAVRSSATAEDLEDTSFAGQHVTVLNVADVDGVADALRLVWASLWHPGPRAYRQRMATPETNLAMGAIVQRMVPADQSGVCFTADPTRPEVLRVEAVPGLGDELVSGRATPEVHQLVRPSLRPVDGTPEDPVIREVARMALLVEEEMGGRAQDIEWSVTGQRVWLLQSRPITTTAPRAAADGFDTSNRAGHQYAPSGVAEMLPGVLSPLLWTINGPMIEEAFRHLFARLGVIPEDLAEDPFAVLARIQGQAALDLTLVKAVARRLGASTGDEIERQYLGQVLSPNDDDVQVPVAHRIRNGTAAVRALRLRRAAEREAEEFEHAVHEVLQLETDHHELRSSELLAYRARVRDLAAAGVAAEVAVAVAAVASYRALEVALSRWVGNDAPRWAQKLTRGTATGSRDAGGCADALWTWLEEASDGGVLRDIILNSRPHDAELRLRATGPSGAALADRLLSEFDRLGSAAVYAGPLWREQPDYLWQILIQGLRSRVDLADSAPHPSADEDVAASFSELEHDLTSTRRWKITRVLTGQVIDVRMRVLRNLMENARRLLARRESVKAALLALGGEERRAMLVLADRLVRRGALASSDELALLADWEVDALVHGDEPVLPEDIRQRAEAFHQLELAAPLAPLVDHRGHAALTSTASGAISGWAASPGVHRGRVRIVRTLADSAGLRSGEVLVAPSTDPSWTPLFLVAGAVVVERGGPLSHAAIVARELGVPAVLNAVGATHELADGDEVEVDGNDGTVTILRADAEFAEPTHEVLT